jgi:hypothetical protein
VPHFFEITYRTEIAYIGQVRSQHYDILKAMLAELQILDPTSEIALNQMGKIAALMPRLDRPGECGFDLQQLDDDTIQSIFLGDDCLILQIHQHDEVRPSSKPRNPFDPANAPIVLTDNRIANQMAQLSFVGGIEGAIAAIQFCSDRDIEDFITALNELKRDPAERFAEQQQEKWDKHVAMNPQVQAALMMGILPN